MVSVDREGKQFWIADPLLLHPAQSLAINFQHEGFIVHYLEKPWPQKVTRQ